MKIEITDINLISGERGVGKTILCSDIAEKLEVKGYSVAGILSPGKYVNNEKTAIFAKDISNGELTELADFSPGWDPKNLQRVWKINNDVICWGNNVLKRIKKCDVLVIDEIGFLEFEKESGWSQVFNLVGKGFCKITFVVVRPGLIKNALKRWKNANLITITGNEDKGKLINAILDQIDKIFAN